MGELGAKIENMGNPVSRERAQDQYDDAKGNLKRLIENSKSNVNDGGTFSIS
jgi:hypothetical protein